jgi:hypothetical protein
MQTTPRIFSSIVLLFASIMTFRRARNDPDFGRRSGRRIRTAGGGIDGGREAENLEDGCIRLC